MIQANSIQALFWDMEGTLVDTEILHFKAWQWLSETYGDGPLTLEEYTPCVGRSGKENVVYLQMKKNLRGDLEDLRLLRYQKFEALRNDGMPLIERNIALVRACRDRHPHLRQYVVSSTTRANLEMNATATGVRDAFTALISYEEAEGLKRKPAPDLYLYALAKAGLDPNEAIAFEDTESGVRAATTAGISVVALPNELTVGQDFSAAIKILSPEEPRNLESLLGLS